MLVFNCRHDAIQIKFRNCEGKKVNKIDKLSTYVNLEWLA